MITPVVWKDGIFHHIVLVADQDSNLQKLYFDGVLKNSIGIPGGTTTLLSSSGKIGYGMGNLVYFNGIIDGIHIWNRALAPDETAGMKQLI